MNPNEVYQYLKNRSLGTTIFFLIVTILQGILTVGGIIVILAFVAVYNALEGITWRDFLGHFQDTTPGFAEALLSVGIFVVVFVVLLVVLLPMILNVIVTVVGFKSAKHEKTFSYSQVIGTDAQGNPRYALPDFRYFKRDAIWKMVVAGIQGCLGIMIFVGDMIRSASRFFDDNTQNDMRYLIRTVSNDKFSYIYAALIIIVFVLAMNNLIKIGKWREYLQQIQ